MREPQWKREDGQQLPFSQLTREELRQIAAGLLVVTPPILGDDDRDTDIAQRWAQILLGV